jgi:hypothetical protein
LSTAVAAPRIYGAKQCKHGAAAGGGGQGRRQEVGGRGGGRRWGGTGGGKLLGVGSILETVQKHY